MAKLNKERNVSFLSFSVCFEPRAKKAVTLLNENVSTCSTL
jgi:hypothetical protein